MGAAVTGAPFKSEVFIPRTWRLATSNSSSQCFGTVSRMEAAEHPRLSDEEMRRLDAYRSEPPESYSFTCDCKATATCKPHGGGDASPFA